MMAGLAQMHLVKHRNVNCLVEMGNTNLSLDNNVMTEILTLEMGAVIVLLSPITNVLTTNLSESPNAKKFDLLVEMEFWRRTWEKLAMMGIMKTEMVATLSARKNLDPNAFLTQEEFPLAISLTSASTQDILCHTSNYLQEPKKP